MGATIKQSRVRTLVVAAAIVTSTGLSASGCKPATHEPTLWPDKGDTILLEVGARPTAEFLKAVETCKDLSADDKTAIKQRIHPGADAHCRLAKFQQGERLLMALDQFCPPKEVSRDSDTKTTFGGESGLIEVLEWKDGRWEGPVAGCVYD